MRVDQNQIFPFRAFETKPASAYLLQFFWLLILPGALSSVFAQETATSAASFLKQPWKPWLEVRTSHFTIYSCAATQQVYKLAGRLEQFRDAYYLLAGAQAVTSPPIVVMAYPDFTSMQPYVPLRLEKPVSVQGLFRRGHDENLIMIALSGTDNHSIQTIFHEYAHLLLRRNGRVWPPWLQEGMADVYATLEISSHEVKLGKPRESCVDALSQKPLMRLIDLFAVKSDSPEYNEPEHQGLFYAESWLLTHYLMFGDNPVYKANFGQLTKQLRAGDSPEEAFTKTFHVPLAVMQDQLQRYLDRGQFKPITTPVKVDLSAPRPVSTRALSKVEVCYRLGRQLLTVGRLDDAESYFVQAQRLAGGNEQKQLALLNSLADEGLGLLAAERGKSSLALDHLRVAITNGASNFFVQYVYARERHRLTADAENRYRRVSKDVAGEIRAGFSKAITLMPSFGPAYYRLGFFEMVQGDDLVLAENYLRKSIELEPENPEFVFSLAQSQGKAKKYSEAQQTLESLRLSNVSADFRRQVDQLLVQVKQGHSFQE